MKYLTTLALLLVPAVVTSQSIVGVSWISDPIASNRLGYSRSIQDPGTPCRPNPCGKHSQCTVNNQGNAICECLTGYIPAPNPVDGCCRPEENPTSPVLLQNRLGPGYVGQQRSGDPCRPSPCGPGTTCSLNRQRNAECRCIDHYVPNPDTITGCRPECSRDGDCRMGYICQSNRCIRKPDPCQPNPCGRGARCSTNNLGNAICRCEPGLIPKPDTITGCGPECTRDGDCRQGFVCQNQRCVEKPDPCSPSPCGQGAYCEVNSVGNAICRCNPGLVPKPDTITGCGPECVRDSDCRSGFVCQQQRCVEKPDPCDPSPCGRGAFCMVNSVGNAICRCEAGLVPKPDTITGCGPECTRDSDCRSGFVCQNQKCIEKPDPCDPSPCGRGAFCMVNSVGNAICRCEAGLVPKPDTITGCGPECTRDSDCRTGYICQNQKCIEKPDPCNPSPCGRGAFCEVNFNGNAICKCNRGLIPDGDTINGCKPECTSDNDCRQGYICQSQKCVVKPDPCDPSPCGKNTECKVSRSETAICHCLPGFVPMPDSISGCDRECRVDSDCRQGYVCTQFQCVERPDPCNPSPCGPNTYCRENSQGNAVCQCNAGYEPQGDTIRGCTKIEPRTPPPDPCFPDPCGPNTRCEVNRARNAVCHCLPGYVPMRDTIQGCRDPCSPNPCGPGAECRAGPQGAECSCPPGFLGDPYRQCRRGECEVDEECSSHLACFDYYCRDPCSDSCGRNANCKVLNHRPICSCPTGFVGDPLQSCDRKIVIGGRYNKPEPEPKSRIVIGGRYQPQEPQPQGRGAAAGGATIGSRYTGTAGQRCAGSGSSCSGAAQGRTRGGGGQAVVIGAGVGRRKRSLLLPFLPFL